MQETVEDGCSIAFEPNPGDLADGNSTGLDEEPQLHTCMVLAE